MQIKLKYYGLLLSILMLFSCGSLPAIDTLNKRIAAFEISYSKVLIIINQRIDEGELKGEDKKQVLKYIKEISKARFIMHIAHGAGNAKDAQNKLSIATKAMQLIREYIARQEQSNKPKELTRIMHHEKYTSHFRYTIHYFTNWRRNTSVVT